MPETSGTGVQPAHAAPEQAAVVHTDTTAKWFLISAISYFFIVGIIALTIAAKFCLARDVGDGAVSSRTADCVRCM